MSLRILQRTCLRPSYPLKRQLIVAYGMTAFVTIFLVVIAATIAAIRTGNTVKDDARTLLTDQYIESLQESGRLTSRTFTKKWSNIASSVAFLAEVVRDRIVGYPDEFADDRHVPFVDRDTRKNKYPLKAKLLPRDWQVQSNWNVDNLAEHTQERAKVSEKLAGFMSTESSFFSFQGNCNPDHNATQSGYHPFCTDDHNNASLGGAINPTSTLAPLEQKAADISVFLKPLWEAEPSAMAVSVYFFNSGAGATVQFPSFSVNSEASYISAGCEWMREINPYTNEPYGREDEIQRCSRAGDEVKIRQYNPMEREFCADQALHPGEIRVSGPYIDAVWGSWRLTFGQAVFDRRTGHFIACTALDVSMELATDILDSISFDNRTQLAVTRMDGTVVAGAGISPQEIETRSIVNTTFISEDTYRKLTESIFPWETEFDSNESYLDALNKSNIVECDGKLYSLHLSPPPPREYDPDFIPVFMMFASVEVEDVFALVNDISEQIDTDVTKLIVTSVACGFVGFLALLGFVFVVAQLLTKPLKWMENVAWQIVNHSDKRVGNNLVVAQEFHNDSPLKCVPKTEASELVDEFESMVTGFSGSGASSVALPRESEIQNAVTWCGEFQDVYNVDASEENKIKLQMNLMAQSVSRRMSKKRSSIVKFNPKEFERIVEGDEHGAEFRSAEMCRFSSGDENDELTSVTFATTPIQASGEPSLEIRSSTGISKKSITRMAFADSEAVDPALRMNAGPVLVVEKEGYGRSADDAVRVARSRLFWWIQLWIACPILLCIVAISYVVALRLDTTFPNWTSNAGDASFSVEYDRLKISASLRAKFAEQVIPGPIRDLHVLTRMSGWLLFGAINRSESFTEMETEFVEECKSYRGEQVCPYQADKFRTPCDCEWNDPWDKECQPPPKESRTLQRLFFMSQKRDYDLQTGDRTESITYPLQDYSADTTSWWTDPDELPGSFKGSNASGYETAYDRLRVASSLSTVSFPLYNYPNNLKQTFARNSWSSYIAFEADGSFIGYAGCNYDFSFYADFESSKTNGAFLVNKTLCPEGKFGYDPRCRSWYDAAKKAREGGGVYLTPPYRYAAMEEIGITAVSPLLAPESGEFIGNVLIDFSTEEMYQILNRSIADLFALLIAESSSDANLVSSQSSPEEIPESVKAVFLPFDGQNSTFAKEFDVIVEEMKDGKQMAGVLKRTNDDGIVERVFYAFAPIMIRELKAVQPDDFSRGAQLSMNVLYSLLLGEKEEDLYAKFVGINELIQKDLDRTKVFYMVFTAVVTALCILVTAKISAMVTKPMISLLKVVQSVNEGKIGDVLPPLKGGSREVHQVYSSFAKLYKILQVSNSSFFSGDLDWALHAASDALQLFQKFGDEKAIAIAFNNLGNSLFAVTVDRRFPGTCLCSENGECCVKLALECYDESVNAGTREFERVESDAEKCEFAQQLADRHFNRAMCLLQTSDDPCSPENAKEQAFADLHLTKQYDHGVKDYMLDSRTLFENSDTVFERSIRRLYGLAQLIKMDQDIWQVWDIYELVDYSDLMLQAAWNQPDAPLFRSMTRIGRLQALEGAVAAVEFSSGKFKDAALLSTRMLVEDEYIIESAFVEAADCLLRYTREIDEAHNWSTASLSKLKQELRQMRTAAKKSTLDIGRSYVLCFDLSGQWNGTDTLQKLKMECLNFYKENCLPTDSFGVVAFDPQDGDLRALKPRTRMEDEGAQMDAIVTATTGVACSKFSPAISVAVKMAIDTASSTASDVYLIYISDGGAWSPETSELMQEKIREASRHSSASIDVMTLGLEVENPQFEDFCKSLCWATRSRDSTYIAAEMNALDHAFETVESIVNAGISFDGNRLKQGLTMEKF